MNTKFVTFKVKPAIWSDFSIRLAKDTKEQLLSDTKKKDKRDLSRSKVVARLLENYLKGNIVISLSDGLDNGDSLLKGVFISSDLWKKAKNHVTDKTANGDFVAGGLGGVIVKLVQRYNDAGSVILN